MALLYEVIEVITATGDTTSAMADLGNRAIVGLVLPALDTGNITFLVAAQPTDTFVALKDKAAATHTITATTGAFAVSCDDLTEIAGYRYVKVVSAATQTAPRTFKFVMKG